VQPLPCRRNELVCSRTELARLPPWNLRFPDCHDTFRGSTKVGFEWHLTARFASKVSKIQLVCGPLRPVYTGDFCCDFLLLMDVKEWMSYKCSRLRNFITTSLSNLLLHILQKEKIATKIAAKIAHVNGPLWVRNDTGRDSKTRRDFSIFTDR
jgi:hypothetical protein